MYDFALFLHDTWRVTPKLTLNLGLRYNFYSNVTVTADPSFGDDTCVCTAEPPSDFRLFDFGPFRSEDKPLENDGWVNLGPRLGFAYNPDGQGNTVIRGGFGVMFSPQMTAVVRQGVGDKVIPFRVTLERTEVEDLGIKWPLVWNDDLRPQVTTLTEQKGLRFVSSFFDPELQNPYAMHYQLNVQRKLARDMMVEVGYAGTRGVKFILHRRFNQIDRITGERPNPTLIPSLYYVDNSQQTNYNALQLSVRKRFSSNYSFDAHYTWGKGLATQGLAGDIGAYYQGDNGFGIQDFFNLTHDRGPGAGDVTQNFVADFIYEVPSTFDNVIARHVIGGWQVSGIFGARSGLPRRVSQSCSGNYHCRPDHVSGEPVFDNWRDNETQTGCRSQATCPVQYLNASAFAEVPKSDVSGVTLRPGSAGISLFRTPGAWTMDFSLAKSFTLHEEVELQWRVDMFNAFNHINYGGPRTNISSSRFGQIRGLSGPMRTMQMGLRLRF